MKIQTLNDLQDRLDSEFGWRLKELDNLKKIVQSSAGVAQKTAVRSAVCLAYAHWEGFVKQSAGFYISFVSCRRLRFDELADCFVLIGARRHVSKLGQGGSPSSGVHAVRFFRNNLSDRANLMMPGCVNTKANLNSEVFEEVACTIGIDTSAFTSRYNQIDEALLGRRNCIAHGEYLALEAGPCRELVDDVIKLIRQFKEELERVASTGGYRADIPG